MPAGIIKTPISGRGAAAGSKDANSAKKSASAERKGSSRSNSGKKLVQTRLPFKLITPGTGPAGEGGASSSSASSLAVIDVDAVEPRKRKLSYDEVKDDDASTVGSGSGSEDSHQRRSNSKENLAIGSIATKKAKITDMDTKSDVMAEDVIALDDEDDSDFDNNINTSKQKDVTPAPIQIKLPLKNKRTKRRKSLKKSQEESKKDIIKPAISKVVNMVASDSSDDIEELAEELNPQKKQKVAETDKSKPVKTDIRNKTTSEEQSKTKESKEESKTKDLSKEVKNAPTDQEKESPKSKKAEEEIPKKVASPEPDDKVEQETNVLQISSSDNESNNRPDQQSSTDHEMDVDDTDTVNKTSPEKEKPTRKSIPPATPLTAAAMAADEKKLDKLTPKQQRLLEQRRKAREEKEQKLQEERRLKQQEKEQREQQRKLERDQKEEQRRKERDQKEEQRRIEREERDRKRQAEMDTKNEEKRKRNEAKEEIQRKKDEDRRRKEQEKEEAEQKKKRAAESFTKFFVQKQIQSNTDGSSNCPEHEPNSCDSGGQQFGGSNSQQCLAFRPFQVKDDMVMAPVTRNLLNSPQRKQLDGLFHRDDNKDSDEDDDDNIGRSKRPLKSQLYLSEINLGKRKPLKTQRDARLERRAKDEEEYDEVQIIDDMDEGAGMMPIVEDQSKQLPRMRAKYLHFADNRRPPYYGTWRKTTKAITARRPMALDKLHFDYDLDSDCEWEEEEPGESLSASEDEKERDESEEESEEEYNEWYVPHGHLSDEELQNTGEIEDGNTREAQRAKLQVLQQEFAQEMKKQTKKIKPRLLGPVWLDEDGKISELYPACFAQTIEMYGCWQLEPLTLEPPPEPQIEEEPINPTIVMQMDKLRIQQLIRLIHGNRNAKAFLILEFLEYLKGTQDDITSLNQLPSKSLLREKIDELATWQPIELTNALKTPPNKGSNSAASAKKQKKPKKRLCWVVPEETLEEYDLKDLTLQNEWSYALKPKVKQVDTSLRDATDEPDVPEEVTEATSNTKAGSHKKRAPLLMSVPRDQPIHGSTKNALISRYLRRESDAKAKKAESPDQSQNDVVVLSD